MHELEGVKRTGDVACDECGASWTDWAVEEDGSCPECGGPCGPVFELVESDGDEDDYREESMP
jgi:hypothetical protein